MDMLLNLNDIEIIKAMMDEESGRGFSKGYGSSVKEVHEITGLSISKVRSSFNKFKKMEWIDDAVKDNQTKCYYVTEKGIDGLEDLTATTNRINEEDNNE